MDKTSRKGRYLETQKTDIFFEEEIKRYKKLVLSPAF